MAHNREKPRRTAKNNFARSQRGAAGCGTYLFNKKRKRKKEEGDVSIMHSVGS